MFLGVSLGLVLLDLARLIAGELVVVALAFCWTGVFTPKVN